MLFNQTLVLINQNDTATIKKIYTSSFAKVKQHVLNNGGNKQHAKTVYQEAFLAMWLRIKKGSFIANTEVDIQDYLFTISKYKWQELAHKIKYKDTTFINIELEYEGPETEEVYNKKTTLIMESLSKLDERCQTLLKLFYFDRKSYKQIAQIMNTEEAEIRKLKYHCQEQLSKMVQRNSK